MIVVIYIGLVHLETLESVSGQCEVKVAALLNSIPEEQLSALKEDLLAITKIFKSVEDESDDDDEDDVKEHDFNQLVSDHIGSLAIILDADRITKVLWRSIDHRMCHFDVYTYRHLAMILDQHCIVSCCTVFY